MGATGGCGDPVPRLGPGPDRRTPRHALARRKAMLADAAVVGKVFWAGAVAEMGERTHDGEGGDARALPQGARPARAALHHGRGIRVRVLARARQRRRIRRAAESGAGVPARRGRRVGSSPRLASGSRTSATFSPITTHRRWSSLGPRARRRWQASSRPRRTGTSCLPVNALSASTPPPRSTTSSGRLRCTPERHPARAESLARFGRAAYQAARFTEAAGALEEATAIFRDRGESLPPRGR